MTIQTLMILNSMSKYEAEQGLRELAYATGLEVVIICPPLIYSYDAPGNFKKNHQCS